MRWLIFLAAAFGLPAAAQVALENSVEKVERFVAASGSVETRTVPADKVFPGDELRYTIVFENRGEQAVGENSIVITNPLPDNTEYVAGTATGSGTQVTFSVDDGSGFAAAQDLAVVRDGAPVPAAAADYTTIRWAFSPALAPGEKGRVSFNVVLK